MMARTSFQFPLPADKIKVRKYVETVGNVLELLPERNRDVLKRRFGISPFGDRETLESIGESYGITRERVRQIESVALETLRRDEHSNVFEDAFRYFEEYISSHGHLLREDRIFGAVGDSRYHAPIALILTLGDSFSYVENDAHFHPLWTTEEKRLSSVRRVMNELTRYLENENRLLETKELLDYLKTRAAVVLGSGVPEIALRSYVDAVRTIENNTYGEWGISEWAEVKPRGMRDKAFIVLKREGRPLHFGDVANRINSTDFSYLGRKERKAHPQTVHNELIKDERFVLVGRGLYALRDWGYGPGTVKDVMREILRAAARGFTRDELIEKVLEKRFVKRNTILLNLQDRSVFKRFEGGRYVLVK